MFKRNLLGFYQSALAICTTRKVHALRENITLLIPIILDNILHVLRWAKASTEAQTEANFRKNVKYSLNCDAF